MATTQPLQCSAKKMAFGFVLLVLWSTLQGASATERWHRQFAQFAAEDANGIVPGATVLVGSSSIEGWTDAKCDLTPRPLVRRGLGGARLGDIAKHFGRLIARYEPSVVVMFAGSNDIVPGAAASAEKVLRGVQFLADQIRQLPGMPAFVFIAITPTRTAVAGVVRDTNRAIARWAACTEGVWFANTEPYFLAAPKSDTSHQLNLSLYAADRLHLSEPGYGVWRAVLVPLLTQVDESRVAR